MGILNLTIYINIIMIKIIIIIIIMIKIFFILILFFIIIKNRGVSILIYYDTMLGLQY